MKFIFISAPTFETWDWSNPDTVGIGGSETSHIEMAQRLAKRGHEVISYAPTPGLGSDYHMDVMWRQFLQPEQVKWNAATDVWVVYRAPELIDHIPEGANIWLICQDVDYPHLTKERAARLNRIVALCETHGAYLQAMHPDTNVCVSSNGIKLALIEQIAKDQPERNPHRLMYASSPDRGLEYLLQIFPRAKEIVPDLELHTYYGFDNIEKVVAFYGENSRVGANTAKLRRFLDQPGVIHHGRTPQPQLLQEWFKAGIWCHPSNFTETSCITCMDAQACGAIPLTSPVWAISENVQFGEFIEGDVRDELVRARYVNRLALMAINAEKQDEIRQPMMNWAREAFGWELWVDQWDGWARADCAQRRAA